MGNCDSKCGQDKNMGKKHYNNLGYLEENDL